MTHKSFFVGSTNCVPAGVLDISTYMTFPCVTDDRVMAVCDDRVMAVCDDIVYMIVPYVHNRAVCDDVQVIH